MNVKRAPLALLSIAALLVAGLALVHHANAGAASDVNEQLVRAGLEGEGDIPLPVEHG